jgi:hypothetical protein
VSPAPKPARLVRARRLLIVALAGLALGVVAYQVAVTITTPRRTTPVYDPPVLAGQRIPGYCSAGVYARRGEAIVLTSSPHCGGEGTAIAGEGVVGPTAQEASCPYEGHTCHASDMNSVAVAADRIPWGHLNVIDLGVGGYRVIEPGATALDCDAIAIGDPIEMDGRGIYRTGTVTGKGRNLQPPAQDGSYFACMITATVIVDGGDSGSVVLVRGIPAGVTSRSFGGNLGFTPLAEGLDLLGLELCTTPDCGLTRPAGAGG